MASAEREPITGVWRRTLTGPTDPPPTHPPCKNSSDLYQFQDRPLAKMGWTCPPQSTPPLNLRNIEIIGWRRGVMLSGGRRMNEVNARRARLLLAWVTVFERVYHRGM